MPKSGMMLPILGPKTRDRKPRRRSLADALLTKTQQRILGALFGQPERSFYASELIRDAGTGSGAAQRELHVEGSAARERLPPPLLGGRAVLRVLRGDPRLPAGAGVVDRIITELGVFDVVEGGLKIVELAPDVTEEEVRSKTEATLVN